MKLPSLLLPLALLFGCLGTGLLAAEPVAASSASPHSPSAALTAQPNADAALAWLQENFPPGSNLDLSVDFLAAATDTFDDPEDTSVRFYVYTADTSTSDARPLWMAWIGVDNGMIVVLVGCSPAGI